MALPTIEQIFAGALGRLDEAYTALGDAADWLRSDRQPAGASLTGTQPEAIAAMHEAIAAAKNAVNQAKNHAYQAMDDRLAAPPALFAPHRSCAVSAASQGRPASTYLTGLRNDHRRTNTMTDLHNLAEMHGRDLVLTLHPISQASPEHIYRAGDEIGELARYLVHATLPERINHTLPYPISVDDLVKNVRYAIETLPQLLDHAAARLTTLAADPRLATDRPDDGVPAETRAQQAATELCELAGMLRQSGERLGAVRSNTARLKLAPDDPHASQVCTDDLSTALADHGWTII